MAKPIKKPRSKPSLSGCKRLEKAIDELYRDEDRQEELIDIICQCFYNQQTTKKS